MQNNELKAFDRLEPGVLRRGDRGDQVSHLQSVLAELEYFSSEIDGHFNDATESALKAFQTQYSLTSNGVFDAQTWYAMVFWTQEDTFSGFFSPLNTLGHVLTRLTRLFVPAKQGHEHSSMHS